MRSNELKPAVEVTIVIRSPWYLPKYLVEVVKVRTSGVRGMMPIANALHDLRTPDWIELDSTCHKIYGIFVTAPRMANPTFLGLEKPTEAQPRKGKR
jgi:hypothetical protein